MRKKSPILYCPKCNEELGIVNIRFASKSYTMEKITDMYYCPKCQVFKIRKVNFEDLK